MFVLWSPLFDYLFFYVFICIFIYWLTYLKICMFGPPYHLFSFHMKNVTLFSGNAIRPHSSPAPVGASRRSPRPFLGGARAPRRFVAGVCMCVSLQEDDLLYPPRIQRFFLPFSVSPVAETSTAYRGTVSRTLFVWQFLFWGIYRVPQRAKLGIELPS